MNPVLVIHKLIDMMLGYARFFYKTSWERVGEPNLLDLTRSVDGKHIDLVPLVAILSHSPRHLQEHITRWKKIVILVHLEWKAHVSVFDMDCVLATMIFEAMIFFLVW